MRPHFCCLQNARQEDMRQWPRCRFRGENNCEQHCVKVPIIGAILLLGDEEGEVHVWRVSVWWPATRENCLAHWATWWATRTSVGGYPLIVPCLQEHDSTNERPPETCRYIHDSYWESDLVQIWRGFELGHLRSILALYHPNRNHYIVDSWFFAVPKSVTVIQIKHFRNTNGNGNGNGHGNWKWHIRLLFQQDFTET